MQKERNWGDALCKLPARISAVTPISALAPMQDITHLAFMKVISSYGAPDYFFTEFFRVHEHSTLEKSILASILAGPGGRPIFAQLIGEDLYHMERTAKELLNYPVAGVDLNMGCPAPKIYKKNVGGGLLRDPKKVDALLGCLRAAIPGLFTVKMRLGFEDMENFPIILSLVNKHQVDLLSIHGRTVKEMYRSEVHYEKIKDAIGVVNCPILANGNITSVRVAEDVLTYTGAQGVMIGRGAVRNPWIFRQLRENFIGEEVFKPSLEDVYKYILTLHEAIYDPKVEDKYQVGYMKKFLNFVGQGVDEQGNFLKVMRRSQSLKELFAVCELHLIQGDNAARLFASDPYEGVIARPNCETPLACS